MLDMIHIDDIIANAESLEFFEPDEYADQEEINDALREMLDRGLY